jgi:eukaryotic-like serine/threonine-protein kinase
MLPAQRCASDSIERADTRCYADLMPFRERLEWILRMGLLVFVLAAAAFLSAITTIRLVIRGREVAMPNLVGISLSQAQKQLANRDLGLKIADRVYDAAPEGNVVRQSPPAGMIIKVSQEAHVVLSLGPLRVAIPRLEGQSLRGARIALLQAGLQLGEVSAPYMSDAAADTVAQQTPPPGAEAASPHVDLLAPLGPRPEAFVMPFVIGMPASEAQRQFSEVGVHNIHLSPLPAPQWPAGTVMDQTPLAGAKLGRDDVVELKVAGPGSPDIHGSQ